MKLNGAMELVLAIALTVGFYTRLAALVLGLHLGVIAFSVGKDIDAAIGMRDAALALGTLAVALNDADALTWDAKHKAKKAAAKPVVPQA